ncbi:MAG: HNH endonuclease [Dehalococcoidales bacterium]|nr:HNH endonuclease [Dehalococcoidales bacterium]
MYWKDKLRNELYMKDGRKCHYCGIEENDFLSLWGNFYGGNKRGRVLEVDRKNNERGYEIENCVLACAVCNNAKSDKFTYGEFKKVGTTIRKIWEARLTRENRSTMGR